MNYRINSYIKHYELTTYAKESNSHQSLHGVEHIDCYDGINNITFPFDCIETFKNIDYSVIKNYPHDNSIKQSIIDYWLINCNINITDKNIILCDGSIGGIFLVNRLFLEPGDKVLGYVPQFPEYSMDVLMHGAKFVYYTLKRENNYKFIKEEFVSLINKDYKLIYIDNPNNPTGQIINLSIIKDILEIAREKNIVVVVDEAYGEYMDHYNSSINLINKYDNLIILKSFSKGFALAGLRAGYTIIPEKLNYHIRKITHPYSISSLSRSIIVEILKDNNFIKNTINENEILKSHFLRPWKKIKIATTSLSTSIFLIYHINKNLNLSEEFYKLNIDMVPGDSYKSLNKNYARLRIPKEGDLEKVLNAFEYIDTL